MENQKGLLLKKNICIQICASNEWEAFRKIMRFNKEDFLEYPYGSYVGKKINNIDCIFYYSKATKTRSAGACQYAIDHWNPRRIIVFGTAGGIGEGLTDLDLVIANRTVQYDCIEAMGSKKQFFYKMLTVKLNNTWIDFNNVPVKLIPGLIATGDQDVGFGKAKELRKHGVLAADWESGAIANICKLNKVPCCIVRGVSDVPTSDSEEDSIRQGIKFRENTPLIMAKLLNELLPTMLSMNKI